VANELGTEPWRFRWFRTSDVTTPLVQVTPCQPQGSEVGYPFTHCHEPLVVVTDEISVAVVNPQRPEAANVGAADGCWLGTAVGSVEGRGGDIHEKSAFK